MRRRFVFIFCLALGLCAVATTTEPLRAQSDYLAQSPHSPLASGWQATEPSTPPTTVGADDEVETPAKTPPTVASTFDESQSLGKSRSANDADSEEVNPRNNTGMGEWMLNTITALGAVVGLILLIRAIYAKCTGRTLATARHDVVQVMARVPVAPRNHVLILRVAGRILIVGDSPGGMNTLAQIDDPDEAASLLKSFAASEPNSISQGFNQLMGRFNSEYTDDDAAVLEGRDTDEYVAAGARGEVSKLLSRLRSGSRGVPR